jgi:hypothetical protein
VRAKSGRNFSVRRVRREGQRRPVERADASAGFEDLPGASHLSEGRQGGKTGPELAQVGVGAVFGLFPVKIDDLTVSDAQAGEKRSQNANGVQHPFKDSPLVEMAEPGKKKGKDRGDHRVFQVHLGWGHFTPARRRD